MRRFPTLLAQAALTNSAGTQLYAGQPILVTEIDEILLSNTGAAPVNVTITAGGTGVANTIVPNVSIPANSLVIYSLGTVIPAGQNIYGFASAAGVVGCTISGALLNFSDQGWS